MNSFLLFLVFAIIQAEDDYAIASILYERFIFFNRYRCMGLRVSVNPAPHKFESTKFQMAIFAANGERRWTRREKDSFHTEMGDKSLRDSPGKDS